MTSGSGERWYRVGTVAHLAGVTVRTLHHYGEIGLLVPSRRTGSGYRLYSEDDLDRLVRVLYYRDLGFTLDDIATLLDDPAVDRVEHVRRQHRLLEERLARVAEVVAAVKKELEAMMSGINLTAGEKLEIFGQSYDEAWETEAEKRWGGTEAWQQIQFRAASRTKADWQRMTSEMNALHQRLVAGFEGGLAPDSEAAMDLTEAHRQWVSTHWDCSPEAHVGLAEMYLADARFTATFEAMAQGLTVWLHAAIVANAERRSGA